ncbi:MAG: hypothetical protein LBJ71_04265, partial [Holosporaceae bacterium]|nr:hypothetical protein [Holosporaceae bacterium]
MSLQNEFNLVAHAFVVGQLVKPSEPNDLETLPIGEDIVVGRFVKKLVDSTGCERIYAMATGDTVDSLFGITLNDNPTATRIDSPRTTYSYQRGDAVAVGRLSSKLSIRPEILVQDSTTDILNAPLYVVCGGDDSGKLLVADTDPTPSETTTYIALDHSSFNLRSEIDTGEVYLEITQIGKGGSTPYTLPIAKTNTLGGIKPDGTTITVDEETGIATATGTEPYELPIAKTNTLGGIKPDGITITVDEETGVATATGTDPYELPIAKTNTLGGIKPDGTTITVDEETGIATAVGGGSSPSPSDTPPLADDTADPGTADTYSRGDHVHPLIADATTNAHGLMSADDKVKLDALNNSIPIQLGVKNGVKVGITDVFGEEDVGVNLNEIRDSEWYEGTPLMVVGVGTDGHGKVFYKDLDESWHSLDVGTVNALESIDCFANTSMVFWLKHLIGGENTLLRITYEDDKFNVEDITANLGLPEFSIKKIRYVESIYDQSAFFLSIAGKGIYRSIDLGDTWELVYSEDENLLINDICNYEKRVSNYSVTVILAVGNAGKFIISSNGGSSWENGVSPDTGDLISIYCNRWNDGAPSIISTAGNGIFTSDDLENWTHILLKDGSQVKIRRLDEHEIYVAYGYKLVGSLQQYYFLFSEDGLTWNEEELPSSDEAKRLNSADESYSRVYLFGNNSKLLIDNARSLVKVIEGVLATNGTLGVVMPDGVTTQVIDGVMSAIGGQQDPTIMFGSQSIEFNQINLKYNKRLGSVPPHDGVKISSYYMIFLKDKAFIVKNLMTDYVFITTTSLEGTVNDYLCINEIMFAITDENTIAKWGNDKWNDYPMEDYSEIKFVSRKSFNYSSYYSIFFVSAKDSSGNYKLLKVDQYSLGTQDLNLNEEVVDVAVSSDGTIYALTPNALFTSKNPAGEGWTKFDDPDSLIKNANFIEIIEEKEYELIVITTSDGNVSVIESGQLFQIYEGNVPIVAVSALFFLLSDDSILRLGGEGRDPLPYETGINVEAISYVEDNLIAINQTTKYSIVGDTMIWCSLMSGYNISPISEGGGGAGNSDRFAREDHVHAFQMPIPYKLQKGDGINLTHQMQNVAKKNQFSGTFFKVLACEDKIIFCASSYIAIYNGLEYLSVDAQFTIKDFAYVNNQLLVIDENDKILYTQTQKTRWTKWNMPPDCVKCINVWAVKSTFFGLFQKEDESFVTARIGETYNSVYTTANEKISCIGELDDSRIILGGQTKYWFPITYGGDEQSHDLPSGITFKKVVRTPDWSIALATDSSKIFVSNDIWGGYVELDVGIPSQITDIYYESSLQLFIAATIDGYL